MAAFILLALTLVHRSQTTAHSPYISLIYPPIYPLIYLERLRRAPPPLWWLAVVFTDGDLWFWTGFSRFGRFELRAFTRKPFVLDVF